MKKTIMAFFPALSDQWRHLMLNFVTSSNMKNNTKYLIRYSYDNYGN